jgi:hypothetical protein
MDSEREERIHRTWREQGQWRWQPALHGLGQPLHVRDLTFRITTVIGPDGKHRPAVECEGIIVERSP